MYMYIFPRVRAEKLERRSATRAVTLTLLPAPTLALFSTTCNYCLRLALHAARAYVGCVAGGPARGGALLRCASGLVITIGDCAAHAHARARCFLARKHMCTSRLLAYVCQDLLS